MSILYTQVLVLVVMRSPTPPIHRKTMNLKIYGLRLFGLWNEKSKHQQFLSQIKVFINVVLLIIYLASMVAEIFVTDNNLIIFDCILHFITAIALLCKFYKFFLDNDRILKLIERIYQPLDTLILSSNDQIKKVINQNLRQENILDTSFGWCFIIFEVSIASVIFTKGKNLPLPGWFPLDLSSSFFYGIIYIFQIWMTTLHLGIVLLVDELIFSLIRWITVQLIILNINYQNCCTYSYGTVNEPSFESSLKTFFQNHQYLIELVTEWNSIFNMTMFSEIATNCFMICLGSFQVLMGMSNPAYAVKFAVFFVLATIQLFVWCWLGSELTAQSELMASGLWSCGWESRLHSDIKSIMIMSMIHTKTILQLKAGKFFVMTMQTFVTVLRSAYSFLALLSATN